MKQTIFTLLLLSAIGLVSCRKNGNQPNIEQYDKQQILNYISTNHISGMVADTTGGDTSGIYYKIILPGSGTPLDYPDDISFVFTLRSFDGKYASTDTILNHFQEYVGHIFSAGLPAGLEFSILHNLKYAGASMRVLIPSHLAYGVNGYGSGSITNTSSRIAGNQCLDYYIHVIAKQPDVTHAQQAYDYQVIQNYMNAQNLTGYTLDSGVYYKVTTQGTGTAPINDNTTAEVAYTGRLLNNVVFDSATGADSTAIDIPDLLHPVSYILKKHAVKGTTISMILPSTLGYGTAAQGNSTTAIPSNSCLRFEFTILNVE